MSPAELENNVCRADDTTGNRRVPTANAPTAAVVTGAVAGKANKATDGQDSEVDGEADVTRKDKE
jgi:hypothetical protein